MKHFINIWFLFPIMIYYAFESIIISLFISFIWKLLLSPLTGLEINYFQWVAIIWIIKVIFFDVFKLVSGLNNIEIIQKKEENEIQ